MERTTSRVRPCITAPPSPARERDLPPFGERSLGGGFSPRESGVHRSIPLVTRGAIPGDHYLRGDPLSYIYTMVDLEEQKIVDKLQKQRALRQARERVRQLERELHGEAQKPEGAPHLPEFLRQHGSLLVAK